MDLSINEILSRDVLDGIFLHCLPSKPLLCKQPDTKIAPMLLAHVCSYWRNLALRNPHLWTHLYHSSHFPDRSGSLDADDTEFLRWWRRNLGALSPFLRLEIFSPRTYQYHIPPSLGWDRASGSDPFLVFLVNFISSAQYLNLDLHWIDGLVDALGERALTCPNLDTLVIRQGRERPQRPIFRRSIVPQSGKGFDTHRLIPTTVDQPIRRFLIDGISIDIVDVQPIMAWRHLTHLYANLRIKLDAWFSLLRECTSLICGLFVIRILSPQEQRTFYNSHNKTLPQLRQLSVTTFGRLVTESLFLNLCLPSLTSLRISNYPPPDIDHLHRILTSTPCLRELQLGPTFSYVEDVPDWVLIPGESLQDVYPPLWSVVPQLKSIHFAGREFEDFENRVDWPGQAAAVLNGSWLQFGRESNQCLTHIEFGQERWRVSIRPKELEDLVHDLRERIPKSVQVSVRDPNLPNLWKDWEPIRGDFIDEFGEDMMFRETI